MSIAIKEHSLVQTLLTLTGNPRGCVYAEPLWGIPFNLYAPYASVYMVALGLVDWEIGLIASISWGFQVFLASISGVVTDKFGRRTTTLVFDIFAWAVPALLSAIAQNFWFFLAAGLVNSVWRIAHTSWSCLLVEDADPDQLADIYTWIYIANLMVGLVAPLSSFLIERFEMVPTLRGIYVFAMIMFTIKAVATYLMTQETKQGQIRLHETKHQPVLEIFSEYRHVFADVIRAPATLYTAGLMLIISITSLIGGSFWAIIVTKKLLIPDEALGQFIFVRSLIMILFFFAGMPIISKLHFKKPMMLGFLGFVLAQLVLVLAPAGNYPMLFLNVILDACSLALVNPLVDRMTVLTVNAKERARILSILAVGIILLTAPFGAIAGSLSEMDKAYPFILNMALFASGILLTYLASRVTHEPAVSA